MTYIFPVHPDDKCELGGCTLRWSKKQRAYVCTYCGAEDRIPRIEAQQFCQNPNV